MSNERINIEHLLSMTGEDVDLAEEVIGIFRQQAEIWSRLLDPRASADQWADAAHSLRGAALSIGAESLAASCERAETAGRKSPISPAGASILLNEVKDDLAQTLEGCSQVSYALSRPGLRTSNASNS